MKYKIGDRVKYIGERENRYSGEVGTISHTKKISQIERDVTGAMLYPKGDFDFTIIIKKATGITFVLNAYENELEFA